MSRFMLLQQIPHILHRPRTTTCLPSSFILMYLALALTGLDLMTSFSAVAACINNLGPGLGMVGPHYADLNAAAKWILCFAMLLGRLEIFTLLVLLSPAFWRK